MILFISISVILVVSLLLAIRSVNTEVNVPKEVENLKIKKKEAIKGVIIFLKEKIIHYTSF